MKYEDMNCGIRVVTDFGPGTVRSYTARNYIDLDAFTLEPNDEKDLEATVVLDEPSSGGTTVTVRISGLTREES